ncbi:GNAT family N-acetyltransferase [Herbaspirillum sp. LeCh32-8]|uniref:GNAT family N-acetyltransferase n=1 Tax=Herbaspirillum sp. LeCh32-8 TaxID=2821356 RepID=UPI001AE272D4|nr:GNAT family protein [Herbaspirillum sp. LeCh32-8]MBP0599529.1 GNAT family N-acetyltransferase [Herbaspirillum sp. LeCh32-8]
MTDTSKPALNEWKQPIGPALPDWQERPRPQRIAVEGRYCRLEPVDAARHSDDLYAAYAQATDGSDWTYMMSGPFPNPASYRAYAETLQKSEDPLHYAVIDLASGRAVGTMSLMRIEPRHGVIEVGHIALSRQLKRTRVATEAQFLLMRYVFAQLGYRRYEWKCDSLNAPSRQAAQRLGFQFEGIFRQAVVYRGRSRDTAWFSIVDTEWPTLGSAFERWLDPANFDAQGKQKQTLLAFRQALAG